MVVKYKRGGILPEQIDAFFEAYVETCKIGEAAKMAGFTLRSVYNWRDKDPVFKERLEEADHEVKGKIEAEIFRRGVDGIDKPVFYQGKVVATVKEHSDRLLELLAYAHMPEKYTKVVKNEHTGKDGAPLNPTDNIEIARRIAFALRQASGGPPPKKAPEDDAEPMILSPMPMTL